MIYKATNLPVAAGLSFLCCLGWAGPLLSPDHIWIYHDAGPASSVFLPVLMNMALLWVFFMGLLRRASRPGRWRVGLWLGVMSFLPWLLLKDIVLLDGVPLPHRLSVGIFLGSGMSWILAMALWRPSLVPLFVRVQHFSSRMLILAGLCGLLTAGELTWFMWAARTLQTPRPLHPSSVLRQSGSEKRPRIVWIILDELSYQQVYGRRFPGLELSAFDELAIQSTIFTNVQPAAEFTEVAVPSLINGFDVDGLRARPDGTLDALHNRASGRWQPFHARDTVFQDALDHGYRTGVAGWYNPYCRILSEVLDRCQWSIRQSYEGNMSSKASAASNLAHFWMGLFAHLSISNGARGDSRQAAIDAQAHLADYRDIVAAGDALLRDDSIDFLFLHIPVPHPGGIYDRRSGSFTTHSASYLDNLALADRYLGHVRQVLEQRGEWDSSAIVVMGDHSWRTSFVWKGLPEWTAEDEVASRGGQFDPRPGYIVKLPYQTAGARIDTPFAARRTRALLDGIMEGSYRSVPELTAFAGQAASVEVGAIRGEALARSTRGR